MNYFKKVYFFLYRQNETWTFYHYNVNTIDPFLAYVLCTDTIHSHTSQSSNKTTPPYSFF